MTTLFVLLIVFGSIFAYMAIGGYFKALFLNKEIAKCLQCKDGVHNKGYGKDDSRKYHCETPIAMAVAWPFTAPFVLGSILADKDSRDMARRKRELDEAAHKAKVAQLARIEDDELDARIRKLTRKQDA